MTISNLSGPPRWTLICLALGFSTLAPPSLAEELSDSDPSATGEAAGGAEEDDGGETREPTEVIYERVMVVGSATAVERIPGSAHFLPSAELEKYHHSDIHRILRQIPGINIQEEDGFGLRPNLGMRGTGVERSSKITLMEDGVLIAPAPYAAPAAYYFPTAGRMEAVEVRKGSAAIKQGPFTTGGAVNLLSTAIPSTPGGSLDLSLGEHRTVELHARGGGSWQRFGFQVETFQQETDGFKRLDGGGDTGFEVEDYLLKLRLNSKRDARIYQEVELKIGHTEQLGKETYLGLTPTDFGATPYRRYAASQNDEIDTEHEQVQLRHFLRPSAGVDLTTTVYRNDFFRNWFKNESTLGTSNSRILDDPLAHPAELAFLRGDADSPDDAFALRNNRREYYSQGIQSVLGWRLETKGVVHSLEFGVRFHQDEEDRFQEDDLYSLRGGRMVLTTAGSPGSQSNRVGRAEALAFFFQDQISFGRWTLAPGVRFEHIETRRLDYGRADPQRTGVDLAVRENTVDAVIPGLAVGYDVTPDWTVFAGVHRGFSPPSPSSRAPVEEERSLNWELGTRYRRGGLALELVGFFNDYDNLLGADTASSGGLGTGDLFNGGGAEILGLEASLSTGLAAEGAALEVPFRATYTYTTAEFRTSFLTGFADWSPEVERGDELPYLPEHQLFAEIGLVRGGWSAFLAGSYVSEIRTKAGQGAIPEDQRVAGRLTFDLAGRCQFSDRYRLYLQVRNLLDETYVAARRPYGLRPGLPRTTSLGLQMNF
ncbi:MAG: TonB-dependent receptor [Thermoanaerobaculia bacterium]